MRTPAPEQLRDLLLHRLPDEQAQRLEEQLMQDSEITGLLREAETDLVDDYARGLLPASERTAFEQHLLVQPAIRQRVKIAHALHDIGDKSAGEAESGAVAIASVHPWKRWSVRAAAVFVAFAVGVVLVMRMNQQAEVREPVLAERSPNAVPQPRSENGEPIASIVLLADLQRSGGPQVLEVRPGAKPLRVQAEVTSSDASLSYRLSIADDTGTAIFSADDLSPKERGGYVFVEVTIPAGTLGTGRRSVTLEAQSLAITSLSWQLQVQP